VLDLELAAGHRPPDTLFERVEGVIRLLRWSMALIFQDPMLYQVAAVRRHWSVQLDMVESVHLLAWYGGLFSR
jgi:hypothetical protein